MRLGVLVSAFCILTCSLVKAGWTDLSANIPWPNDSMDLSSVYFIGTEGWITASYAGDSGFVFHTTDGGQTFEVQHTQYPAYSAHMVTRLEGYACGWNGRVYRTTDAGANWNTLGTLTTTATCIDFPPDRDTGYCCGYTGNIARVTPDGVSRMVSNAGTVNLASISFPNNPHRGWVCGESVILLFQRDTWAGHYSYPFGAYHSICFVDSMTGWACGDDGLIVHTDDNANFVPQATPESIGLFGSCFVNSNCGWVVGGLGTIERTTDGGQHWRIEAAGVTDHFLTAVFAVDTGTAYVVGDLKVFLKYDGRGGVEESPKPQATSSKLGPTFVHGVLLLPRDMTELPGNSDRVPRPALLDAAGRKVLDLAPGANDVRALAPGVYFVHEAQAKAVRKIVVTR